MDIHGGPEGQSRPSWNVGAQYFAAVLGATVILPNVRGSTGYGKRYADLDNAEKREDSVKDIGALLDWIATQPNLDKNRVAVYGQSYGGYMSLAVSTHYADRLVGSVERYGISDFASFLKNTEAYRRDNRRAEYGDERDSKMQAVFKRIAPLANVAKITKPMLVMQGANDPRVPKSESDQVVAGIRANGVETWYVVFADEGHGFLKKPNNDLRREVETVFLRKLFKQPARGGGVRLKPDLRVRARPSGRLSLSGRAWVDLAAGEEQLHRPDLEDRAHARQRACDLDRLFERLAVHDVEPEQLLLRLGERAVDHVRRAASCATALQSSSASAVRPGPAGPRRASWSCTRRCLAMCASISSVDIASTRSSGT